MVKQRVSSHTESAAAPSIAPGWFITWVAIFALILASSIFAPDTQASTIFKLGGIVLCLLYAARAFPHDHLLLLAMLSTSVADIILASNNISPLGVIVFLFTQLIHLYRLGERKHRLLVFIYASLAAIAVILDLIFNLVPVLFVAVFFYALTLITNLVVCALWHRREPGSSRAFIALLGFAIFVCCDVCTGLSYLSLVGILPNTLYAPANFFVWLFYYPSQVLISNTGQRTVIAKSSQSQKLCYNKAKGR